MERQAPNRKANEITGSLEPWLIEQFLRTGFGLSFFCGSSGNLAASLFQCQAWGQNFQYQA